MVEKPENKRELRNLKIKLIVGFVAVILIVSGCAVFVGLSLKAMPDDEGNIHITTPPYSHLEVFEGRMVENKTGYTITIPELSENPIIYRVAESENGYYSGHSPCLFSSRNATEAFQWAMDNVDSNRWEIVSPNLNQTDSQK